MSQRRMHSRGSQIMRMFVARSQRSVESWSKAAEASHPQRGRELCMFRELPIAVSGPSAMDVEVLQV